MVSDVTKESVVLIFKGSRSLLNVSFHGPWTLEDEGDRFLGNVRKTQRRSVTFRKTVIVY